MKKLAVLISNKGTGTNLQAIIDGTQSGKINAGIMAVVSDTKEAWGLERARKHRLPIEISPQKEDLLPILQKLSPDFICLAGWKQVILDEVIDAFPNRILNTHPGLIPDTVDGIVKNPDGTQALWNKSKMTNKAIQNFLDNKATYAGCTNHFLSKEFDFGPVLGRCFEKIKKGDTADSLYKRLKVKENELYVNVLSRLCTNYSNNRKQTILIVDGGGRGAVLVDKYAQSRWVKRILVVPGNDLMQINTAKEVKVYPHLKTTSVPEILRICREEKIDLVDVAHDNAVEVGLVNEIKNLNIPVVGPTKEAGQIEWDKAWAREFMVKYNLPHPKFKICYSEKEGENFLNKQKDAKWFVKASGLAEGKGALPADNNQQAMGRIKELKKFGKAGDTYLLEEWLIGEEFSAFALCDGENFVFVGTAQDHKRVNNFDEGENTGGMGCVSNPLLITKKIKNQILDIFNKTVKGLKEEGREYKGVLYLGGIVVDGKVYIIEYNARWGDPEAEVIVPSIKNDLYDVSMAIIQGSLKKINIKTDDLVRVIVTGASRGYPADHSQVKGKRIFGIKEALKISQIKIYGAGVKKDNKNYLVNGGRVIYTVGSGKTVVEARKKSYEAMSLISIEGNNLHFRTDIGWRDVERLRNKNG